MVKEQERIAVLETHYSELKSDVAELKGDVKAIKENHLPHLQERVNEIHEMVKYNGWRIGLIIGAVVTGGTIIFQAIVASVFK